jgi:phospholipid/cholesterol/gamma-HCH transport system substrate-binding protein
LESSRRDARTRDALQGERGSTLARVAALGALVAAVALIALAMFGGGDGYKVKAVFDNAGQLVPGNPVLVGGGKIGTIDDIELDDHAQAVVTLKLEDDYAPLHSGTTATIRSTSLSGIANRYVSLQPGPNSGEEVDDGGSIGADDTAAPVDLDTLFNTLDKRTRAGLRNVIRGFGDQYDGKGKQAREATKYFSPFLVSTSDLTRELASDQKVLEAFVTDTSDAVTAIAERRDDLANLVTNANTAFRAIGDESAALSRALDLLPDTLRKANTTFVNLRSTLDDLEKLVDVSKPNTRRLAPFLAQLRPVIREARPTIADLNTLVRQPGANNDLIELTQKQPRLAELTSTVLPRAIRTLDRAQPVFEYARSYTPDLAAWVTNFGQLAASYDANGHYARVQPMFLPSTFSGGTLTANQPSQKLNGFDTGNFTRCPGAIVQPAPDGSNPVPVGSDCSTSQTPPGP